MTNERWLLPEGIEEVLPDEARRIENLRRELLDLFASWGYELVMPPLVEYLDALLTGVGSELDLQTFKLTDQLTGRLLGVRADITPQAARIDAHYLKRGAPTRLCYAGAVLRTRPEELGGTREPLQIGAELYGFSGPAAETEILCLMAATVGQAGIAEPHIDLGHVGVFRALAAQAGLSGDREAAVFDALQRKARPEAERLLAGYRFAPATRDHLLALLDLCGDAQVLREARTRLAGAPRAVGEALDNLEAVAETASGVAHMPPLHFDLAELSGYRYYTGIVFSTYASSYGRAICRGGRYDGIGKAFGRDRAATGFGADLRQLLRLSTRAAPTPSGILAPAGSDPALRREVERLRAAGERVVMQLADDKSAPEEFGCDRVLVRREGGWATEKVKS